MTNVKNLINRLVDNYTDPNENLCVPTEAQVNYCMAIFMENPDMWNNGFHLNQGKLVPGKEG